jgi:hypothetical protein
MGRYNPPKKMKILLLLLIPVTSFLLFVLTATVLDAAPYGTNIPLPTNASGILQWNDKYTIDCDSYFGGHWHLEGRRKQNRDGTYLDTFRGTISDRSISGTFTKTNNFIWLSDSWWLDRYHTWLSCDSFNITISGGNVSGTATFRIP